MKLRETVLNLARSVPSTLSAESLASLALYRISQLPCFQNTYQYMNLVKEGSEYALRSPYLNNIKTVVDSSCMPHTVSFGAKSDDQALLHLSTEKRLGFKQFCDLICLHHTLEDAAAALGRVYRDNPGWLFYLYQNVMFEPLLANPTARKLFSMLLEHADLSDIHQQSHYQVRIPRPEPGHQTQIDFWSRVNQWLLKLLSNVNMDNSLEPELASKQSYALLRTDFVRHCIQQIEAIGSIRELLEQHHEAVDAVVKQAQYYFPELEGNFSYEVLCSEYQPEQGSIHEQVQRDTLLMNRLSLYDDFELSLNASGMFYTSPAATACMMDKPYVVFRAVSGNTILGFASLYRNSEQVLYINTVCTAHYCRNQGVMSALYREIARYAVANNLILVTTLYSEMGAKYLPSLNARLSQEQPNLLWLTTYKRRGISAMESARIDLNRHVLSQVETAQSTFRVAGLRRLYEHLIQCHPAKQPHDTRSAFDRYSALMLGTTPGNEAA